MPKYIVRHGVMRLLGVFSTSRGETFSRGAKVIARTARGMEAGEVLCVADEHAVAHLSDPKNGQVLRKQSHDDEIEIRNLFEQGRGEYGVVASTIKNLNLNMELVDLEHIFGGERVVVYYLAEKRIDFRELVKVLAKDFQTRIEMRQIGVRDEAKLLADYGDCGKPLCCNTHLAEMPPVSMRMAKLQKATLDPTKISGRCGRLKCCLRYEFDTYVEMQKDLPPVGSEIITSNGRARVLAQEILASQLLVQMEDMRRTVIPATDVVTILKRGSGEEQQSRRRRPKKAAPKETQSGAATNDNSTKNNDTKNGQSQNGNATDSQKPGKQE